MALRSSPGPSHRLPRGVARIERSRRASCCRTGFARVHRSAGCRRDDAGGHGRAPDSPLLRARTRRSRRERRRRSPSAPSRASRACRAARSRARAAARSHGHTTMTPPIFNAGSSGYSLAQLVELEDGRLGHRWRDGDRRRDADARGRPADGFRSAAPAPRRSR